MDLVDIKKSCLRYFERSLYATMEWFSLHFTIWSLKKVPCSAFKGPCSIHLGFDPPPPPTPRKKKNLRQNIKGQRGLPFKNVDCNALKVSTVMLRFRYYNLNQY
uniref:Uncharacterized protein n=1 Tax=Cacopsylla melanoneura TaxID=428564 RepID=A0A8D8U4K1_9HEMI